MCLWTAQQNGHDPVQATVERPRQSPVISAQATLSGLVERLACDHPHHVVYTLLALKNGNRGRDGKVTGASPGSDALHYNVDLDKVAAAQEVLQRTSARGHL